MITKNLPLTDLHRHLDGNIRTKTILELGQKFGVALPAYDVESLTPHVQIVEAEPSLVAFLSKLDWGVAVLGDLDACRRVAYENVEDALNAQIDYAELRFSPYYMAMKHKLPVAGVVEAVVDGVQAGMRDFGIKANLIGIMSLIGIVLGLFAFNRVVAPITSTASAAKHLAKGDWESTMPQPGNIYETTMLVYAFNEMANNLKASFRALRSQLLYDSLTKLYSREGLIDSCDKLPTLNGSLMLVGIKKFRDINDSLGHYKGDQLLINISQRLHSIYSEDHYLARIGGDEFAIYTSKKQTEQDLILAANRIHQVFASPFVINNA